MANDKTKIEKPPRPANVVETSRMGNKVVGVIDKRTGKQVGGVEKPKRTERSEG